MKHKTIIITGIDIGSTWQNKLRPFMFCRVKQTTVAGVHFTAPRHPEDPTNPLRDWFVLSINDFKRAWKLVPRAVVR